MRLQAVSYLFFRDESAWSVTQRSWDPYSQVLRDKRGRKTSLLNFNAKQRSFKHRAALLIYAVTIFFLRIIRKQKNLTPVNLRRLYITAEKIKIIGVKSVETANNYCHIQE